MALAVRTSRNRAGEYSMRKGLSGGDQVRTEPFWGREKRLTIGHVDREDAMERVTDG